MALDQAWEIFLKSGRLNTHNLDIAKGALAFALLDAVEKGERNPRRLAISAVARVARYENKLHTDRMPKLHSKRSA
jgi:hypothetical protein